MTEKPSKEHGPSQQGSEDDHYSRDGAEIAAEDVQPAEQATTLETQQDQAPAKSDEEPGRRSCNPTIIHGREDIEANRIDQLHRAILKAQTLLAFSAEANAAVPKPVIASITNAQRAFGTDSWSLEIEQSFWSSFREISGILDPVTSGSINWVNNRGKRTTLFFISLGVLSLVTLVLAQIFWVYINNTSTQIEKSIRMLSEKNAELVEQNKIVDTLIYELGQLLTQPRPIHIAQSGDDSDMVDATTTSLQQQRNEIEWVQSRLIQSQGRIASLKVEINRIRRALGAQSLILADWVPEFIDTPIPKSPSLFESDEERRVRNEALDNWKSEQNTQRETEREYLLAHATSILALMSTYVLPLLYGALGTFAYILRSVSRGVRDSVLDESMVLNYWARIPLGMLSGVAVGWFLNIDSLPTGWEAVQPLALAFVAGYSVELIFTALDRLVGAFTGSNQPA